MIMLLAAGALSYSRLGRSEDPPFTVKTWSFRRSGRAQRSPTPCSRSPSGSRRSSRKRRTGPRPQLHEFRGEQRSSWTSGPTPGRRVPDIWYQVRKKVDDIRGRCRRGSSAHLQRRVRRHLLGIIYGFTADGFTHRELRDYVEDVRSRLLLVQDVNKVDVIGAQDERIYLEFSAQQTWPAS